MPKRIAILIPHLGIGGAERVSIDLVREFVRRGHAVDFVLMRQRGELLEEVPEGVGFVDLKAAQLRQVARPLASYLKDRKPDALLANLWPLTSVAIITTKLIRSRTVIFTVDHSTLSVQYQDWGWPTWLALHSTIALIYPFADGRIAVSHGVAKDVSALGWRGPDFLDVIFNPVATPAFNQQAQQAAARAWSGWNGPKLITVGTLKEQKDHAMLLRAFKVFLQSRDARLLILGAGHLFDQTAALARQLGLTDKVIMPGAFRFPGPFYASADLFVLSSTHEGLPTVMIEAMACGIPVVSTDCKSGPAEILENGRYGLLTPVRDAEALAKAMLQSLDSPHDRDALRRRAAEFSPEKAADKYLELMFPDHHA